MEQDTEKIIEEYISKAPEKIKEFIASQYWTDKTENVGQKLNLSGENISSLKNEALFVLIGMEPRSDFRENIKNELGIDINVAEWVAEDVEKEIFSNVSDELDEIEKQFNTNEPPKENTPQRTEIKPGNNVGEDFERIMMNQARAMQPAQPVDSRIMNHESRIMGGGEQVPNNLPTEPAPQHKVHDYKAGADPYREPIG